MAIANVASSVKALDIIIIDIRKMPSITDYFVIASGTSTTQVKAIADHIMRKMKGAGQRLWHVEGEEDALWILLDYGDVVGHIFYEGTRRFYELERLWADAPRVPFKEITKKRPIRHARNRKKPSKNPSRRKKS